MVEAMEESYGGSTQESSGVSVVRPNTSLLGDPCDVVVALILWGWFTVFVVVYLEKKIFSIIKEELGPFL